MRIQVARAEAVEAIAKLIKEAGLDRLEHHKHPLDRAYDGVGFVFSCAKVDGKKSAGCLILLA